tara:strand:- start:5199 stop:5891 length:693 start_codon:yes stop_codon:yes gene_type:complete
MIHPAFGDMTVRDILATYADTYIQLQTRDDDGFYSARLLAAEDNGLHFEKPNGDRIVVDINDSDVEYKLDWPTLGMVNIRDHVVLVERIAQRQWKKGLRMSSLRSLAFDPYILRCLQGIGQRSRAGDFCNSDLIKLYTPEYTDFHEALEVVEAGEKVARAISPLFCVSNKWQVSKPLLYYKSNAIGVVTGTSVELAPEVSHIIPLLKRIVPNGYHNSIVMATKANDSTAG